MVRPSTPFLKCMKPKETIAGLGINSFSNKAIRKLIFEKQPQGQ